MANRITWTKRELEAILTALGSYYETGDMADAGLQEDDPEDVKEWEAGHSASSKICQLLRRLEKPHQK